ncbi:TetR/AcrR family transcriptional regulator [Lysinibacillus sp. KU-BSD001]|uniref:TetR/AcrR family transcriptional regulator n=1 Tax=Lysinibacillus sp. KU-BSD001 TaxID=3141328 RepID=UPI0036E8AFA4
MVARKKAHEELTKEMIIQEANRQFLLHDFHKVSMRAIAKELGCSHGAIYYYFANKSELFYAVVEQYFDELNRMMETALTEEDSTEQQMMNVFLGFIQFGLNYQSQYEFMFSMRDEHTDPLAQQASNNSYTKFAETLQKLSHHKLALAEIYSTFIALHGFVSHYYGRVKRYEEAHQAAVHFSAFLMKALEKS